MTFSTLTSEYLRRDVYPSTFLVNFIAHVLNPARLALMRHFGWSRVATIVSNRKKHISVRIHPRGGHTTRMHCRRIARECGNSRHKSCMRCYFRFESNYTCNTLSKLLPVSTTCASRLPQARLLVLTELAVHVIYISVCNVCIRHSVDLLAVAAIT